MPVSRIRPATAVAVTSMALPVAYIIKKHVDWETKPDSKRRMLIHHLTFWSTAALGLKLLHDVMRKHRQRSLAFKAPRMLGAGLLLAGGFEAGERLARWLVPKKPAPTPMTPPAVPTGSLNRTSARYQPSYLSLYG